MGREARAVRAGDARCPSNRPSVPFRSAFREPEHRPSSGDATATTVARVTRVACSDSAASAVGGASLPNRAIFGCFVSRVNHRQAARILHVNRKTIERRLRRWGPALKEYHERQLERVRLRGGLGGTWTLDEQETFEHDRRLAPVTLPILIQWRTYFVLHAETAPLPARGNLSRFDEGRKKIREERFGRRRNGSAEAVTRCFEAWRRVHDGRLAHLITDRKSTYPGLFKRSFVHCFGSHVRIASTDTRNHGNPLFPINHTLAMLREHVSRLARRTWAASKLRERLELHLWIWIAWRNYVRGITNQARNVTPAMATGVTGSPLSVTRILRWRWPRSMPLCTI
jgi:hypothetical protein